MSNFSDMDNVYIMDHPLIQHKISILRNKDTGTNEFRKLIEEIAVLMGFEALRDLPLEEIKVETPNQTWYHYTCSFCEDWAYWSLP